MPRGEIIMKLKGKILVLALWIVLSFAAAISATFAWVSENKSAQAGGMSVRAETTKSLLISNSQSGTFDFSATSTISSTVTMSPSSTIEALTNGVPKFYTLTPEAKIDKVAFSSGALDNDATLVEVTPTTTNPSANTVCGVIKYTFYLKINGDQGATLEDVYASNIQITRANNANDQSNFSKSLRVALVCGSRIFIYSVTGGDSTYNGISTISNNGFSTTQVVASSTADANNILLDEITTNPVAIDIYVWYEGQDTNCTTSNSLKVEDVQIAVAFSASEATNN